MRGIVEFAGVGAWPNGRRAAGRGGGRRAAAGFTLLELVLVLVIVALAAAVAAPSLRGFMWGRRADDTATTVRAMLVWAQGRAAEEAREYRLEVGLDREGRPVIRVTAQDGGAFVYPGASEGQTYEIPPGMEVVWEEPAEALSSGYVMIHADGTHDAGRLRITDGEGRNVYLRSMSATEPWRVMTAEERAAEGLR